MKKMMTFTVLIFSIALCFPSTSSYSKETSINGFVSQGYLKTNKNNFHADTQNGSFEFNEMGLKFSHTVSDNLFLGMQFFARDLGNLGNDEIIIDWAYADYIFKNAIGLRAGKIKIPYGFYNEARDSDMLRTAVFLPSSVYSEAWRDSIVAMKGLGIYGTLFKNLSYQIQTGTSDLPLTSGIIRQYEGIIPANHKAFTTDNFSIASVQWSEIVPGLRAGFGYFIWEFKKELDFGGLIGAVPSSGDIHCWITGLEYICYRFTFATEYSLFKFDAPIHMPGGDLPVKTDTEFYYVSFSYQLTDRFSMATSYSATYADKNDRDGEAFENLYGLDAHYAFSKVTSLAFRYDINSNWIFKLEGQYIEGSGAAFILDNKDDNGNTDLEKYWNLFAAKLMFIF